MANSKMQDVFTQMKGHQPAMRQLSAAERIQKLKKLREAITRRRPQIEAAIYKDFRKCAPEAFATEILTTYLELGTVMRGLKRWMKPQRVKTPLPHFGTRNEVHAVPRGVVLIIGPWNYPFALIIHPLIAALAAGNCAILKPSELTPHVSAEIVALIREVFDENEVAVFEGGADVTQELLKLPFDHFFFTGSHRVGQIVAEAAAKHLSTVTLELGGKSPTFIDRSANLKQAAARITWGKFINGAQTCVAPDYVFVPEEMQNDFVQEMKLAIEAAYGATPDARKQSADYARIINDRNFARITAMTDQSVSAGAKIAFGGATDAKDRYIEPTLLTNVSPSMPIMKEEIFGPVLPILTYKSLDEAIAYVNKGDKALSLYVFARDSEVSDRILASTVSGGSCVNTSVLHFSNPNLPFGGVGASGFGNYHGKYGFLAFSHHRAVMTQGRLLDLLKLLYPPYTRLVRSLLEWIARLPA